MEIPQPERQPVLQTGAASQHDVPQSLAQRLVNLLSSCPSTSQHMSDATTRDAANILSFIETRLLSWNFTYLAFIRYNAVDIAAASSTTLPTHNVSGLMLVHWAKFDERWIRSEIPYSE